MIDRKHNGIVASIFEYPVGWQVSSSVDWNFEHVSFPMVSYAQVRSPQGIAVFEFLPSESFFWLGPMTYQQGLNLLGQTCMPPRSAVDAMTNLIIPKHRANRQGLRTMGASPVPQLAQMIGADLKGLPSEGAAVRIEYTENGIPIEEEFYGVRITQNAPYYGPLGPMAQANWFITSAFCFRARRGELAPQRDMFWSMACSVRVNSLWEQHYYQILQELKMQFDQYIAMGYAQIQAAGQMSRFISANNDALLNSMEQQRLAARRSSRPAGGGPSSDRSATDGFDEYIRGVETVEDPYWGESRQDSSYRYHWTDGFGNYRHSNDAFFNPNYGSNQTWTLMQRR